MGNSIIQMDPALRPQPRRGGITYTLDIEAESEDFRVSEAQRRTSSPSYRLLKRTADLCLCAAACPIAGPVLLALAIAVRLTSPGPVFYREARIGRSGRPFTIFKFRSMYTREYMRNVLRHNECEQTELHRRQHGKGWQDPRITTLGRYLRKSSLDELPQLFNVIRGDMSLVGPRPVVSAELPDYGEDAVFYELTLPGVTGLWQVSGRSNLSFRERVRLDARYCSEWSMRNDLRILLRTIPAVIKGRGAH